MKLRLNQNGFSPLEVAIFVIVMGLVGGSGYYVYNQQQAAPQTSSLQKTTEADVQPSTTKQPAFELLNGKITLVDDGTWQKATGGYWDADKKQCGRGNESVDENGMSSQGCRANLMLIPKTESFTNPDQFNVNVTVFDDKTTKALHNGDELKAWIDTEVGESGPKSQRSFTTINGNLAYRNLVTNSAKDVRLTYGIKAGTSVITVRAVFFDGDWYSYKSTKNYLPYQAAVDKLAESITVDTSNAN